MMTSPYQWYSQLKKGNAIKSDAFEQTEVNIFEKVIYNRELKLNVNII